ncbi:UNVERIFIED_ORG: autophagy-related protein 22-2 [Lacrimispora saccharolytica]
MELRQLSPEAEEKLCFTFQGRLWLRTRPDDCPAGLSSGQSRYRQEKQTNPRYAQSCC